MILEDVEYLKELETEIEKGNVDAMVEWASYYTVAHPEIELDEETLAKVLRYYFKGTQSDHPVAYLNLGAMYYNGKGRPKDYAKAFVLYRQAAKLNEVRAMCNLGYCYYYGTGVERNLERAYHWFFKGAMMGNDANCYYRLHEMYELGEFVSKDEDLSFLMLSKCFENIKENESDLIYVASRKLGRCYLDGKGCAKNPIAALEVYQRAEMELAKRLGFNDAYVKTALRSLEKEMDEVKEELFSL